jgi:4-amino-4-deoxy-L-arabinose transferase-like glycosyltransferase
LAVDTATEIRGRSRGSRLLGVLPQDDRGWARLAWAAVVAGALLRLLWVFVVHPPYDYVSSDMQGYVDRAVKLASGGPLVRSDALYPPGTHMLLSLPLLVDTAEGGLRGGAAVWWALSSATVLFAWRLALRLLSPAAAAVTAVLCALYPLFIFYAGYFTSETPSLAFLVAALWLGYRSRDSVGRTALVSGLAAGALGGAAIAMRPQFLLNLLIVAAAIWGASRTRSFRPVAVMAAGLLLVVGPVIAHNSAAADKLIGLNENGAHQFFQSHCDVHLLTMGTPERGGVFSFGGPAAFERGRGQDYVFPDHQPWDQGFFVKEGLACIRDDGLGHVSDVGRNLLDATATTTPFPFGAPPALKSAARATNLAYCLLLPFAVVGAVLLLRRRRAGLWAGEAQLLLHLACIVPVIIVFLSEPRYRIPYDVFGLMLIAALLVKGPSAVRRRAGPRSAGTPRPSAS